MIVHLGEDTDPQILGFEGPIQIYFTSQGSEQFVPKPSAIKGCSSFWWQNNHSWDRQGRRGGGVVALYVWKCFEYLETMFCTQGCYPRQYFYRADHLKFWWVSWINMPSHSLHLLSKLVEKMILSKYVFTQWFVFS